MQITAFLPLEEQETKELAATNFNLWLKSLHPLDIVVYTDRSQETDELGKPIGTGAGWAINWVGGWHSKQGKPLGDTQEVYDAEARAILGGFDGALKSPMARVSPGLHIRLDNLSVARNAGLTPKGSSQGVFKRFRETAKNWLKTGKIMTVQWIPGHMGIEGNEIAEKEAKGHAKTPSNITTKETQSLSNAKQILKGRKDEAWQQEWQADLSLGAAKT